MKAPTIGVVLIAVFVLVAAAGGGPAAELQPYQAVRGLQSLQDRIATGDTIAQAAHAKAIGRITRSFVSEKPEAWHDPRNARALIAFLFSGGDAASIERAIPPAAVSRNYELLYDGALAYGLGDDARARASLSSINPATLPDGLGGHLALVQATLSEAEDKTKALALLDLARLLEPGTLVEEAALRKEIGLIGPDGDLDKLSLLARRYQAAFPQSVYASNFRQIMWEAVMRAAAANTAAGDARLERLAAVFGLDDRRRIFLAIARRETIAGHLVSAGFAAARADRLSTRGDRDDARARLYRGATAIVGPDYAQALEDLDAVSDAQLDPKDQALHVSALSIAAAVHRVAAAPTTIARGGDNAVVAEGERSLSEAEALLRTTPP